LAGFGFDGLNSEPQNNQPQNFEGWNRCALSFESINKDRITAFDIRYSVFDLPAVQDYGRRVFASSSLSEILPGHCLHFDQTGRFGCQLLG
jgi:hypothetical protein